jgi:hypothetical protein
MKNKARETFEGILGDQDPSAEEEARYDKRILLEFDADEEDAQNLALAIWHVLNAAGLKAGCCRPSTWESTTGTGLPAEPSFIGSPTRAKQRRGAPPASVRAAHRLPEAGAQGAHPATGRLFMGPAKGVDPPCRPLCWPDRFRNRGQRGAQCAAR